MLLDAANVEIQFTPVLFVKLASNKCHYLITEQTNFCPPFLGLGGYYIMRSGMKCHSVNERHVTCFDFGDFNLSLCACGHFCFFMSSTCCECNPSTTQQDLRHCLIHKSLAPLKQQAISSVQCIVGSDKKVGEREK